MKKLGLILLLSLPVGCAPSESTTPDGTPSTPDSNATSAAVEQSNISDDATTTKVVIAVPNMH